MSVLNKVRLKAVLTILGGENTTPSAHIIVKVAATLIRHYYFLPSLFLPPSFWGAAAGSCDRATPLNPYNSVYLASARATVLPRADEYTEVPHAGHAKYSASDETVFGVGAAAAALLTTEADAGAGTDTGAGAETGAGAGAGAGAAATGALATGAAAAGAADDADAGAAHVANAPTSAVSSTVMHTRSPTFTVDPGATISRASTASSTNSKSTVLGERGGERRVAT